MLKISKLLPWIGTTGVQVIRGVNFHTPHIYLNAGLAKIEELERREDENQEYQDDSIFFKTEM